MSGSKAILGGVASYVLGMVTIGIAAELCSATGTLAPSQGVRNVLYEKYSHLLKVRNERNKGFNMVSTWCPMCARSLRPRQRYCSNACKQKAYRDSLPIIVMSCCDGDGAEAPGEGVCNEITCVTPTVTTRARTVTNRNADVLLYNALQDALWKHAKEGRSVTGAMSIVQKVFTQQGYTGLAYEAPLPRLSRSLREQMGTYNAGKHRDAQKRSDFLKAYQQGYEAAQALPDPHDRSST